MDDMKLVVQLLKVREAIRNMNKYEFSRKAHLQYSDFISLTSEFPERFVAANRVEAIRIITIAKKQYLI